jgi:hypothetical protein
MSRQLHLDLRRRHQQHDLVLCVRSPMLMMNYWWVTTRSSSVLAWGFFSIWRLTVTTSSGCLVICVHNYKKPTCRAWRKLKHLTRYLLGTCDMSLLFSVQTAMREIFVYADADCAKGSERRSVSSGQVQIGGCVLGAWSRRQSIVTQSSAESEVYAILTGANEGVAVASLLAGCGISLPVVIYIDSSSGTAIC